MSVIPVNPLDAYGAVAGWEYLFRLAMTWVALFAVSVVGVVVAKAKLARRRQRIACPEEDGARAIIQPVRDEHWLPVDIASCSLRPGETPVRCGKSCLHEAA